MGELIHDMTPPAAIAERIDGVAVALLNKVRITRELIMGAPALRLIALAATGTDNVDIEAASERGVAVCNIRDYCTPSVVQHVLGAILDVVRVGEFGLGGFDDLVDEGPDPHPQVFQFRREGEVDGHGGNLPSRPTPVLTCWSRTPVGRRGEMGG